MIYAQQIDSNHYEIQVGRVVWHGEGKWTDIPLPERREIVRLLVTTDLTLADAMEGEGENVHSNPMP